MSRQGRALRLRRSFRGKLGEREPVLNRFLAIMGDGDGNLAVPGAENIVYVRVPDRGVVEALNTRVSPRNDLPVVVGYTHERPETLQVLDVYENQIAGMGSYAYVAWHHQAHELGNVAGGDDVVWVQKSQIVELLGHPTDPTSLQVLVEDGNYPWVSGWNCFDQALAPGVAVQIAALAAGEAQFILVSIDGATNALQTTDGAVFPALAPPADRCAMIPAPPVGSVPITAIYITSTTITIEWDNLYDVRLIQQPMGGSVMPSVHTHANAGQGGATISATLYNGVATVSAVFTHSANVMLDDGVGDSPAVQFIPQNNDVWTMFAEEDATPGDSDLVVTMPATDADARFIWRNAVPADVAYVDAAGNADFNGHVAIGPNATVQPGRIVNVVETAINTTIGAYGLFIEATKTAGITDHADTIQGLRVIAALNQVGGVVGHVYGSYAEFQLDNGDIGTIANPRHAYGARMVLDLNGGIVRGNAYGARIEIDQNGGTVSGDAFGLSIFCDFDGTVTGTAYLLFLDAASNVDYSIYSPDNIPSYHAGDFGIGTIVADRLLHVEVSDAVTNTITYAERLSHTTSGAAAALFGTGLEMELEDAGGAMQVASELVTLWSTATAGAESPLLRHTTYPIGSIGPGYGGFWTWNDLDDNARAIIPNGAGDATAGITAIYYLSESGGGRDGGIVTVDNGAGVDLYDDGVDVCTLTVNADGSVTIVRSAGAATFDVALQMVWI